MRPAWLDIHLSAITENTRRVRRHLGPRASVLAVMKANAYGHGLLPSAMAALRGGAAWLGVAVLDEALELRDNGVTAPVLLMGAPLPDDAGEIVAAAVSQVVSTREAVEAFSRAAVAQSREIGLHLKIDTGMARVGADPAEAVGLAALIAGLPGVRLEGVCTHFATSDEDAAFLAYQAETFQTVVQRLEAEGLRPPWAHAANSGAVQNAPDTRFNLARPGLLVFGCPPVRDAKPDLLPALEWKARVTQVRAMPKGRAVGYGLTRRLERDSRLAVVPLGYADGWPRSLSNRGRCIIGGEWAPVMGRVSMDQFLADVTDSPNVAVGDEVVLVGEQGDRRQTVDDVAYAAGTITHEILTGLSLRLPRVYHPS